MTQALIEGELVIQNLAEFREQDLQWTNWIFVGCGGNYYFAQPLLHIASQQARTLYWLDPDTISPDNWSRQWPLLPDKAFKVQAAGMAWPQGLGVRKWDVNCEANGIPVKDATLEKHGWKNRKFYGKKGHRGVVLVCLPDNDQARLDTMKFAEALTDEDKADYVAVVVTGTDLDRGQAYYAIRFHGQWLYDWRGLKKMGGDDENEAPAPACGQSPKANMLTAVLLGECLQEALYSKGEVVNEFRWGTRPNSSGSDRVQIWTSQIVPDPTVTE